MSYTCFEIEISDKVAHIKLNRPEKRNSMNLQFWDELPEIIADIDSEVKARVIVISSTGPHFSAGLDVQANPVDGPELVVVIRRFGLDAIDR